MRIREAEGPYLSPTDLLLRTTLEKHETERLVLAGALDVFDRPRGELLWILALDFDRYAHARAEETRARTALFGPTALLPPQRTIPVPATYTPERLLEMEVETLGLTASFHPSELLEEAAPGSRRRADHRARASTRADACASPAGSSRSGACARAPRRSSGPARRSLHEVPHARGPPRHGRGDALPARLRAVGHRLSGAGPYLVTGAVATTTAPSRSTPATSCPCECPRRTRSRHEVGSASWRRRYGGRVPGHHLETRTSSGGPDAKSEVRRGENGAADRPRAPRRA